MKIRLVLGLIFLICLALSNALAIPQHGSADGGYWPIGYNGDTFMGIVTATDDASRSITLTYTNPKKGNTETLTASFKEGYAARWSDGTTHEIKPSDFKIGTHLKIYYLETTQKVNSRKVKTLSIWKFKTVADN